jgi:hypothetical protein
LAIGRNISNCINRGKHEVAVLSTAIFYSSTILNERMNEMHSIEMDSSDQAVLLFQQSLAAQLRNQRFSTIQEKQTQLEVELFLIALNYSFQREKRLNEKDIPDFLISSPDGAIVLEVKTRCPKKQIYRQLERYAKHESVVGLILLTGTSMGLPPVIERKPAIVVSLGEGWLA